MGCVWGHGYHGSWFLRWNLEHRLFIKEHFGINTCGRQGAQPCIGTGSKLSCHGSQYRLLSIFWGSVELEWPSKVVLSWFLSLVLFMWCIMFIDLQILYHPCIPGMNPTWSWWMIFLIYCWMRFANILLRILASMFISDIGLKFSFFLSCFIKPNYNPHFLSFWSLSAWSLPVLWTVFFYMHNNFLIFL